MLNCQRCAKSNVIEARLQKSQQQPDLCLTKVNGWTETRWSSIADHCAHMCISVNKHTCVAWIKPPEKCKDKYEKQTYSGHCPDTMNPFFPWKILCFLSPLIKSFSKSLHLLHLSPLSQMWSKATTSFQMRNPSLFPRLRVKEGGWHCIHWTPLIICLLRNL